MQRTLHDLHGLCAAFAARHGLFDGLPPKAAARKAEVIATFLYLCSPRDPVPLAQELALELTVFFFYVDDMPPARLAEALPGVWRHPAYAETLARVPSDAARAQLHETFQWLVSGIEEENALRVRGTPLTLAEYERVRPKVIFVDEYVGAWLAGMNVVLDDHERRVAELVLPLAREAVFLVNDLASVDRDAAAEKPDPNLVLLTQAERGSSLDEAIEEAVARHDGTMEKLEAALRDVRGPLPDLVRATVEGNWRTHHGLAGNRYGREVAVLERLARLRPS